MPYSAEFFLALKIGPAYPSSALDNPDRFREWPSTGPTMTHLDCWGTITKSLAISHLL